MLAMSGCASNDGTGSSSGPTSPTQPQITGVVRVGQQPVAGAVVQLYAAGNKGSKSASTPLITQTVLTSDTGAFNITGLWNCNSTVIYGNDPLVYVVATGGNPGIGGNKSNAALALMIAVGPCSNLSSQTSLVVDEVTTVTSAYALSPFMADITHVGTGSIAGLRSAFDTVSTLVNPATGLSPGRSAVAGESVPVTEINSLANSLHTCAMSDGSSACASLFAATTEPGSVPTNTVEAALAIAKAPERSPAAIYSLAGTTAAFSPALAQSPSDWTMMLRFTGGGLSGPAGVAVDAAGNAWVANGGGSGVTGLSNQGALLTGSSGYSGSSNAPTIFGAQGVAVDRTGNVWLADTLLSTVVKLTVSGGVVQSSGSFSSGINGPTNLALDSQNNVWVANFAGGSVTELNNVGGLVGSGPLTAGGTLKNPFGVAVDSRGSVWVTDNAASVVVKFDSAQSPQSGAGYSDGVLLAPLGIAIDSGGRAWVSDNGISAASLFANDGSALLPSPLTGGGLALPSAVALDGAGVAWLTNGIASGSLTKASYSSASTAVKLGGLAMPAAVAIDASGNVWTANSGDDSVSKFVGLAAPVVTPLASNLTP